ncbi:hypothetical protein BGX28_010492 [Mortierella sp. GBA30]|nr:hypothetical protein BGX28_010492 [Mortierella sp. GBA30]
MSLETPLFSMTESTTISQTNLQVTPAPFTLQDIHLIRAHSPEIIQRTWANNKLEWGKTLDPDTYFARERHLASQDFSSENRLQAWVLVPRTFDPEYPDLDLILSAVETYERPGIIATKEQGLKDVLSISVASVFTPAQFRGYGYASHMMKLLWKKIEAMDKVAFTYLYSDIGPKFYGRLGWTPKRSDEMVIPVVQSNTVVVDPTDSSSVDLDSITDANLSELMDRDAELVRASIQSQLDSNSSSSSSLSSKTALVVVTPEPRCIRWLHARSAFAAEHILKLDQCNITSLGAKDAKSDSFVLWYHDLLEGKLRIIRWRLDIENAKDGGDDTAKDLIRAAVTEAQKWNLSSVVIWNPEHSLADLLGLEIKHRESSIPSLGLTSFSSLSTTYTADNVDWILSEKYAW